MTGWTTSGDIEARLGRMWERGDFLRARLSGKALFPMTLPMRRPSGRVLGERFDDVRAWIRQLEAGSRSERGYGYEIRWSEINHRQLGPNRVPERVDINTEDDALRLLGKRREVARFDELVRATRALHPSLCSWIERKPLVALDSADDWGRILSVLSWFRSHPRSGLYLRQLDIAGVDTKFIESRQRLIAELLDAVLSDTEMDRTASTFEDRFGLLAKPSLLRLRILDPETSIGGLRDIATPSSQLAAIPPPVQRIFITENEINGLALPAMADSAVIFGLGYGLQRLFALPWLRDRELHYWGDIDTHGFAMLSRVRAVLPHTRALMMDRATLLAHRQQWVTEGADRQIDPLPHLTDDETELHSDLVNDRLGPNVRLEQERIAFGWVTASLRSIHEPRRPLGIVTRT